MGGKALGFESCRLPAREYECLVSNVIHSMYSTWVGDQPTLSPIPAYGNKETFGDADILFSGTPTMWDKFVKGYLSHVPCPSGHCHSNGNVFSVGVNLDDGRVFQVDFIYSGGEATTQIMRTYFAYNDLGNLMGRVAHRLGMKWGQDGLVYVLRDPVNTDRVLGEYNLTGGTSASPNLGYAFDLMGYDYMRWRKGFDTLEDVFEFAASSRYFHPEIYLLENRNAISRARDSKRATYSAFLIWCEENSDRLGGYHVPRECKVDFKEKFFHELCASNTALSEWYHSMVANSARARMAATVFNGSKVAEVSGLQGHALGALIAAVRGALRNRYEMNVLTRPENHYEDWIFRNPTIVDDIIKIETEKFLENLRE